MNLKKIFFVFVSLIVSYSFVIYADKLSKKTIGSTEFYCYKVKAKETLFGISKKFNITQDELKRYNPAVIDGLKKDYVLLLPVSLIDSRKDQTQVAQQPLSSFVHIVKKGETLYGLSKTYGILQEDIVANNPQVESGLKLGEEIIIPQPIVKNATTEQVENDGSLLYHTIEQGETLYRLSKNYNTSIENILRLNPGISPENFKTGTVIKIMANAPKIEKVETTVTVMESYVAERGDNMKKIARRTGVDVDDLEDANPNIGKVKSGMTIQIPVERTDSIEVVVSEGSEMELRYNDSDRIKEIYDSIHYLDRNKAINIALMLPYMLNSKTETKQAKLYTEFYKGFLLALKDVNAKYDNEINVYTYDTEGDINTIMSILSNPELKEMDLIFAPDGAEQLDSISAFGKANGIYVVNAFSVKDENYDHNPYMFQINIPQDYMYVDVCNWVNDDFKDYEVVFIHKKGNTKKDIVDNLKQTLEQGNRIVKEIEYASILTCERLLEMVDVNKKTLFIPTSGSKSALSQMIPALKKLKNENPLFELAVVGYPEWTVYMEDWKQDFHIINAHFYSRVFINTDDEKNKQFNEEFQKWYGEELVSSTPVFGYLGYDTGLYFLRELCKNGKDFNQNATEYVGLQSAFNFGRVNNWGGFVNQSLYLIHFDSYNNIEITTK